MSASMEAVERVRNALSVKMTNAPARPFSATITYLGRQPETKHQIVDMALNGSGIRDTARVLRISPSTVIAELKKEHELHSVNMEALDAIEKPSEIQVVIRRCDEAEMDEMWSFVRKNPTNDGFGMQSITKLRKYWLMCWVIVIGLFINRYGFGRAV